MKTKDKKAALAGIKDKTDRCLESRKHANDIIDIISKLQVWIWFTKSKCMYVHKSYIISDS